MNTDDSEPQKSQERQLSPWEQEREQRQAMRRQMFAKVRSVLSEESPHKAIDSEKAEIVIEEEEKND